MIKRKTLPTRFTMLSEAKSYITESGCKNGHDMSVTEITPDQYSYYLSLYGIDKPGIYVMDNRNNKLIIK